MVPDFMMRNCPPETEAFTFSKVVLVPLEGTVVESTVLFVSGWGRFDSSGGGGDFGRPPIPFLLPTCLRFNLRPGFFFCACVPPGASIGFETAGGGGGTLFCFSFTPFIVETFVLTGQVTRATKK